MRTLTTWLAQEGRAVQIIRGMRRPKKGEIIAIIGNRLNLKDS
jgi:hypothetical protein